MATGDTEFRIETTDDFRKFINGLRRTNKKLSKDLSKRVTKLGNKYVKLVKANVRKLPMNTTAGKYTRKTRPRKDRLRSQVSRGVKLKKTGKAGLRIITTMPSEKMAFAPLGLETKWRHPLFGNPLIWYEIKSPQSWFWKPLGARKQQFRAEIVRALNDAANGIVRGDDKDGKK